MGLTLDEFLTKHTSRQLSELIALERVDPPDDQHIKDTLAMLCSFIWNANRGDLPAKDIDAFRIMYGAEYTHDKRMEVARERMRATAKVLKARCERQGAK